MEKKEKSFISVNHPAVCLNRDDFEKIIEILKEISDKVKITDDEYVYESLDELIKERGTKLKTILISSSSPTVSLKISAKSVDIFCSSQDKNSLYSYHGIIGILKKRRTVLSRIISPAMGYFFIFLFAAIVNIPLYWPDKWPTPSVIKHPLLFTLLLFSLAGISLLSWALKNGALSSFVLLKSHEQQNFFTRKKDDLILIFISGVVGAVIGALITKFLIN